MKAIKKEVKQSSLIHQRIRNASFVPLESHYTEKFKYNLGFKVSRYFKNRFIVLKNKFNKIIQKTQLWLNEIDFKSIREDLSLWIVEALIEGFVINFIVWALMGFTFSFITVLAWGFAMKQLLSVYWRLRKDGSHATIPKKDK